MKISRLTYLRRKAGFTKELMSRIFGVRQYSLIERGLKPSEYQAHVISSFWRLPIEDLLELVRDVRGERRAIREGISDGIWIINWLLLVRMSGAVWADECISMARKCVENLQKALASLDSSEFA